MAKIKTEIERGTYPVTTKLYLNPKEVMTMFDNNLRADIDAYCRAQAREAKFQAAMAVDHYDAMRDNQLAAY